MTARQVLVRSEDPAAYGRGRGTPLGVGFKLGLTRSGRPRAPYHPWLGLDRNRNRDRDCNQARLFNDISMDQCREALALWPTL